MSSRRLARYSRHWPDRRVDAGDEGDRPACLPLGPALCRLARPDAKDHSTAGKTRLGAITRAGDETLRSLLVVGATSVIQQVCAARAKPVALAAGAARAQAAQARGGGARQQDGAHRLEADGERRNYTGAAGFGNGLSEASYVGRRARALQEKRRWWIDRSEVGETP